jgi:hypothetical protein
MSTFHSEDGGSIFHRNLVSYLRSATPEKIVIILVSDMKTLKSHVIVVNCISVARREFLLVRGVDAEINAC